MRMSCWPNACVLFPKCICPHSTMRVSCSVNAYVLFSKYVCPVDQMRMSCFASAHVLFYQYVCPVAVMHMSYSSNTQVLQQMQKAPRSQRLQTSFSPELQRNHCSVRYSYFQRWKIKDAGLTKVTASGVQPSQKMFASCGLSWSANPTSGTWVGSVHSGGF